MESISEDSPLTTPLPPSRTSHQPYDVTSVSTSRSKHPYPSLPRKSTRSVLDSEIDEEEIPIKTVVYVPNRSRHRGRFPVVSVHKNKSGRFVVVEQRPVHTYFSDRDSFYEDLKRLAEKERKIHDQDVKFRSVKPPWKWSTKGNKVERSFDRQYFEPHLPPLQSKYETEARIGSLQNINHQPKGGDKKVPSFKVRWDVEAKVGSLDNIDYRKSRSRSYPNSETSRIRTARSDFSVSDTHSLKLPEIKARYGASGYTGGAFNTLHFNPEGDSPTPKSKKNKEAKSKVGSLDNINYTPGGGNVKIQHYPPEFKAESKIDSLEKIFHEPGGGDVTIIDLKPKWKSESKIGSLEKIDHTPKRSEVKIQHFKEDFRKKAKAKVGSLNNIDHIPQENQKQIFNSKLNWKKESKISALWKTKYKFIDPADPDYDEDAEIERRIRELMSK